MRKIAGIILFFCLSSVWIVAQDSQCLVLVEEAISAVADACEDLARNQVCYGHNLITATQSEDATESFLDPGDIIEVINLRRLKTTTLSEDENTWGIALFALQADLPDSIPGQNLTFVVYGNAELSTENAMQAFRFSSGVDGSSVCDDVPRDGLLLQTPQETTVNFTINGVEIEIGSTGLILFDDEKLIVNTLEGLINVTRFGVTRHVDPGFQTTLIGNLPPTEPEPYDHNLIRGAPVELLPEAISVPLVLPGDSDWMDTGIMLREGQEFYVFAEGTINFWANCEDEKIDEGLPELDCSSLVINPEGGLTGLMTGEFIVPPPIAAFPAPDIMPHSLIGRVGDEIFFIGEEGTFIASTDGRLQLRVNDFDNNNSGAFFILVETFE